MDQPDYRKPQDSEERDEGMTLGELEPLLANDDLAPKSDRASPRPSIYKLFPYYILSCLSFGVTMVPKVNLLASLVCSDIFQSYHHSNPDPLQVRHISHGDGGISSVSNSTGIIIGGYNPQCANDTVGSAAALWSSYRDIIVGVLGASTGYILGRMSDRHGRIRILLINGFSLLAADALVVMVALFAYNLNMKWLYASFVLEGLCGSVTLTMAMVATYAADTTPEAQRSVAIGWIHGSMFFGVAAGPLLGSAIRAIGGQNKPSLAFYVALAIRAFSLCLLGIVPESRPRLSPPDHRSAPIHLGKGSIGTAFTRCARSVISRQALHNAFMGRFEDLNKRLRANLALLMAVNFVLFGAAVGTIDILMLYPQIAFKWNDMKSGIFISAANISRAVATAVVLPLVVRYFRRLRPGSVKKDSRGGADSLDLTLLQSAIMLEAIGFLGYGFAPTGFFFLLAGVLASFGAVGLAVNQAAMTKIVSARQTGELMGLVSFLQAMARVVVPPIVDLVYAWAIPWTTFIGIAAFLSAGFGFTLFVRPRPSGSGINS